MAAGLRDPALLRRWREDPGALAALGVDPGELDLDALGRFAGLTVKVRHNPARDSLPATFRLLQVTGLEVELFAAYAAERAASGRPFAAGTEDRARELVAFLEGWVDAERPEQGMLYHLARHEQTLAELAALPPGEVPPALGFARARAVPHPRGEQRLRSASWDPRAIVAALQAANPDLGALERRERYLCYWRLGPALRLVELDLAGYRALELVDGRRTAGAIARALTGGRDPRAGLALLTRLGEAGLIAFR